MRRDSSNSSWLPSPYRSCLFPSGSEANSYLSDDDLLYMPDTMSLPVESIPTLSPKKELTTEEQIALLREVQEKEATTSHHQHQHHQSHHSQATIVHHTHDAESRRRVVRFASHHDDKSSRRPSMGKRRQTAVRRGLSGLNGPQ